MIERVLFIVWGLWLLLLFVAACRVFGFLIARRLQDRKWGDGSKNQKPAVIILPVKGFDLHSSPKFFDAILAQDYSEYRVVVCFESWDDTIAQWLKEQFDLPGNRDRWDHPDPDANLKSVTLVCAGPSKKEGQKVHNQRAAFENLTDRDEIVVFADADIFCKSDWLAKLVAPINQKTHPLSTTYRWLVPKRPTLPNQLASVINASVTTQGGSEITNVLWGGSMAIARPVFDSLDVPKLFEGSLNDDLRLSKAARKAGNRIAFVRSLILPTMIDFKWGSFIEFTKRQYTQVKFFSPILYTGTNIVLGFYVLGLATIIAAIVYGYFLAWVPIAAAYVIDQFRALARQQVYLSLFEENGIRRKLFAASWLEHMLTPFWMTLHWFLIFTTWTQSRITWAGVRYRIHSKSKTKVLKRQATAERLPVGVPGLSLISDLRDRHYTRRVSVKPAAREKDGEKVAESEQSPQPGKERTYSEIEDIAASITGDGRGQPPVRTESPETIAIAREPVSHPGAPSAVRPLTATRLRAGRRTTTRRSFGHVSPVEKRLKKTRLPVSRPRSDPDSPSASKPPQRAVPENPWPSARSLAVKRALGQKVLTSRPGTLSISSRMLSKRRKKKSNRRVKPRRSFSFSRPPSTAKPRPDSSADSSPTSHSTTLPPSKKQQPSARSLAIKRRLGQRMLTSCPGVQAISSKAISKSRKRRTHRRGQSRLSEKQRR